MALQTIIYLREDCPTSLRTERRAAVRYPSEQDMTCQPATCFSKNEVGTTWLGTVRDISLTGIGFTTSREFAPGRILILELSDAAKGIALRLPARVVHATPKRKNRWMIGCEFTSPISEEQLQRLLEE